MPNIFDIINAREISTYYVNSLSNITPFLGATLFPARKQLGLDLSWIKGSRALPIVLQPSAFDTKATVRDRVGFDKIETEMPFFKESMRIKEKDRQELNKAMMAANSQYIMPIINFIFDDVTRLVLGAEASTERMRMQLLSTGGISIAANRVNYDYNYNFREDHKETLLGTAMWTDFTNSDPVDDIIRWLNLVEEDTGVRPAAAICSRKTWLYLMSNKKIKLDMNPIGGQNIILTDAMLKQYLQTKLGISVAIYNKKYQLQDGTTNQFFPDDVFTLIPDGDLGNTYFGTTPEESDLMTGSDAMVSVVNTGVAITTTKETDPVNVITKVSSIMLPSFETIDCVFIAKVNS